MAPGWDMSDPDVFTKPFQVTPTCHRDIYPFLSPENPQNAQQGKIVVVIGGGDGIGAAAAKVWARAGAEGVVLVARRVETLEKVASEIQAENGEVQVVVAPADVTDGRAVQGVFDKVHSAFGRAADVMLNVAGYSAENEMIGDTDVEDWWKSWTINLKGSYAAIHHFIQSQKDPKAPTGTVILVSGNRAGLTEPGHSAYNISKLAQQRLVEHVHAEYPTLRAFTTTPGIVLTKMITPAFAKYAVDHPDLLGALTLYLAQPRADYLRGDYVSVNWDMEELETRYRDDIVAKKLLKTSWLPVMPVGGGSGLGNCLAVDQTSA
ncbi:NAD(P)-binding protein [Apiospora kogelbergensis]|uniref:NAD(P)-binding protein n=1 Tax=Apiospora kogelbergensis TaxID=1337665 RepID=UPI00312EF88B